MWPQQKFNKKMQLWHLRCQVEAYLHEAAEADDGIGKPGISKIFLCAAFDLHEWHLWVALTVMDGKEDIACDAHRLRALNQGYLAIPVHLAQQQGNAR